MVDTLREPGDSLEAVVETLSAYDDEEVLTLLEEATQAQDDIATVSLLTNHLRTRGYTIDDEDGTLIVATDNEVVRRIEQY